METQQGKINELVYNIKRGEKKTNKWEHTSILSPGVKTQFFKRKDICHILSMEQTVTESRISIRVSIA